MRGRSWVLGILPLLLCGTALGQPWCDRVKAAPTAKPDEALIIFLRPRLGGSTPVIYDATGPDNKLVAILNNHEKFGHAVKPGEYLFMVVSGAADFMKATVEPGKTYYVLVRTRPGFVGFNARHSFLPLRQADQEGKDFSEWNAGTFWAASTPECEEWVRRNAADTAQLRADYWPKWTGKKAEERAQQTLNAEDGR